MKHIGKILIGVGARRRPDRRRRLVRQTARGHEPEQRYKLATSKRAT